MWIIGLFILTGLPISDTGSHAWLLDHDGSEWMYAEEFGINRWGQDYFSRLDLLDESTSLAHVTDPTKSPVYYRRCEL